MRGLVILPTSDNEEESLSSHRGFVLKSADDQPMMSHSLLFLPHEWTKKQQDDKSSPQVLIGRKLQATQTWIQRGADIDGETAGDYSGASISLSGDGTVLAVGAPNNDGTSGTTTDNRGHVRVYKYDATNSTWIKLGADIDGEGASDNSGLSVSLSDDGTVLAVGALNNDGTSATATDNRGHVRVYRYGVNGTSAWTKLGADIDGEGNGDNSGRTVSLSGDGTVLAVGAPNNDGTNGTASDNRGHVRV